MLNKNCKARVKLSTSHVPNLLLMSMNNRISLSIPGLGSAHVKFDV